MTVELRDLRWAIVASQHRSLRQAAEALNIQQSTLSRRLRDIEYRLGAALFERTTGGTRPTAVGREFLATARRIVCETDAAFSRLKLRHRGENGHLVLGVYAVLSAGNLRATLSEHHRRFPAVEIHATDGSRQRLLSDLVDDGLDVAIMPADGGTWSDRTLPAAVHRDLVAYAGAIGRESGQAAPEPAKLIVPMVQRFMATDRGFAKTRRETERQALVTRPGGEISG